MGPQDEMYACRIFLRAALPLLRVIVENSPSMSQSFANKTVKIQVSAKHGEEKLGMHFDIQEGVWKVNTSVTDKPDLELEFKSVAALNAFFAGKSKMPPKIKGWYKLGLLIPTLKALLTMAKLLGSTAPPEKEEEQELLVRLYFYLLSSGISQLNKAGHPLISRWAKKSPDRVYAWRVVGRPELSAYIRVKAGNTKSARGEYKRSKPFFTMSFDSVSSALGILLQTDEMFDATVKGRLIMEGPPEYGAELGDYMLTVAGFAK